jgi:hypothetical protein
VLVLKKLVLAVVVLCVLLAGIGMLLPRQVHVERSIVIDAPRATVFSLLDGFKQFNKWSPWAALDPNAKYTREGPEFGVGAKQSWTGDPKTVGSGGRKSSSLPLELVKCHLDFGDKGARDGAVRARSDQRHEGHVEPRQRHGRRTDRPLLD